MTQGDFLKMKDDFSYENIKDLIYSFNNYKGDLIFIYSTKDDKFTWNIEDNITFSHPEHNGLSSHSVNLFETPNYIIYYMFKVDNKYCCQIYFKDLDKYHMVLLEELQHSNDLLFKLNKIEYKLK